MISPIASEGVATRLPICTSSVAPVTSSGVTTLYLRRCSASATAQRLVPERRLPARVDDGLHCDATKVGVNDQ